MVIRATPDGDTKMPHGGQSAAPALVRVTRSTGVPPDTSTGHERRPEPLWRSMSHCAPSVPVLRGGSVASWGTERVLIERGRVLIVSGRDWLRACDQSCASAARRSLGAPFDGSESWEYRALGEARCMKPRWASVRPALPMSQFTQEYEQATCILPVRGRRTNRSHRPAQRAEGKPETSNRIVIVGRNSLIRICTDGALARTSGSADC